MDNTDKITLDGIDPDGIARQRAYYWNLRANRRARTMFESTKRGAPRRHSPIMRAKADSALRRLGIEF